LKLFFYSPLFSPFSEGATGGEREQRGKERESERAIEKKTLVLPSAFFIFTGKKTKTTSFHRDDDDAITNER
jgi:hypothetical protein